jgi:hypothetical protein
VRVGSRSLFVSAVVLFVAAGCSTPDGGPSPGSTPPGGACAQAGDCGCWQCDCEGVSGLPGAAQLCVSGKCPTGEEACTPLCAVVNAKLSAATATGSCP